jgi:hypothetical protein
VTAGKLPLDSAILFSTAVSAILLVKKMNLSGEITLENTPKIKSTSGELARFCVFEDTTLYKDLGCRYRQHMAVDVLAI